MDPNTFVGPTLEQAGKTSDSSSGSSGGGVLDFFTKAFGAGASAFQSNATNDLQSALAKQNAKTAATAAATAQANQSSTLKIVLIVGGALLGVGVIFGMIALLRGRN